MVSISKRFPRSHGQMPILNTLEILTQQTDIPFYAPGHKRGQGSPHPLVNLLGKKVFQADLPELPALDNLFTPEGIIQDAQALAAKLFGSQQSWFLVNGSTCGVMAGILATCHEGDKIIVPSNAHQSAIAGLILSGATPIFVHPEYDPQLDLVLSLAPEAVEATLECHPETKAIMMVYPTYQGICGDIQRMVALAHHYDIPLLVDEAHGAHFSFHPHLPQSALAAGADLTVQSIHKTLGAMTQASMLHLQGNRIAPKRISQALQLLQSTSPSYLLLASLDAARHQMAVQGKQLMTQTLELAAIARTEIAKIPGLSVVEPVASPQPGFQDLDLTRLTVQVKELGLTGFEADEILSQQFGVTAELPMLSNLTFILTLGNTQEDIEHLIQAFKTLASSPSSPSSSSPSPSSSPPPPLSLSLSPRQGFFSPTQPLPLDETPGRISAELVCPYPPGIPLLMPGVIITEKVLDSLQQILALGGRITGCSDSSLKTLKVIVD